MRVEKRRCQDTILVSVFYMVILVGALTLFQNARNDDIGAFLRSPVRFQTIDPNGSMDGIDY